MTNSLSTNQKAAILVAHLDRQTADLLLAEMSNEQAAAVRRAVIELDHLDPQLIEDVLDEFRSASRPATTATAENDVTWEPSGAEADDNDWVSPRHPSGYEESTHAVEQRFRCLHGAKPATLARYFQQEHPQTIAVVFSHLAPEQSADVLACLPAALQADVLRRLADLEETDPELLHDIESSVETWLIEQDTSSRRRRSGLAAIQRILASAELGAKDEILANLGENDRVFAQQLGYHAATRRQPELREEPASIKVVEQPVGRSQSHGVALELSSEPVVVSLSFTDLESYGDESLALVFGQAEPEVIRLALAGAPPRMVDHILCRLPSADQAMLRRALAKLGPLRLSDVELSQRHLVHLAEELTRQGILPSLDAQPSRRAA